MNLEAAKGLRVLFVGDSIIDVYRYVTPIGKAIKESTLSVLDSGSEERFMGGVWAAAEHVRDFCAEVDVLTDGFDMVNTRYVEPTYMRKLFTLHAREANTAHRADGDIAAADVVVVTDFGHGTMTKALIERVTREAKFLAVNAQTNSTNYGFNLVTKYPRADLVVIDELEARLAMHDRHRPLGDLMQEMPFANLIVTRGNHGAIGKRAGCLCEAPATATTITDTMGAGDAFLALVAPFAATGMGLPDLLRLGNAAAAVKVGIVGHRQYVTKEALLERLT